MVSHLLNIHAKLAKQVVDGLRLKEMPKAADAAKPTLEKLKKSPALSIIAADGFRRSGAGKLTRNQKRASFVEVTKKQVQPVSLHTR
jgi:catalase